MKDEAHEKQEGSSTKLDTLPQISEAATTSTEPIEREVEKSVDNVEAPSPPVKEPTPESITQEAPESITKEELEFKEPLPAVHEQTPIKEEPSDTKPLTDTPAVEQEEEVKPHKDDRSLSQPSPSPQPLPSSPPLASITAPAEPGRNAAHFPKFEPIVHLRTASFVDSDTETLITNSPPRIRQGRKLVRKRDLDNERKRRVVSSSEDEASEEDRRPEKKRKYKIKRDLSGRSQLQRACKKGDVDEVVRYLNMGADANESDFGGFTCLHEAALAGHTDVVEVLIEHGADVNRQAKEAGDNETPLMDAAENNHVDTVKVLLEHGADALMFNSEGLNALTKIYHLHAGDDEYREIIEILEEVLGAPENTHEIPLVPSRIVDDPNDEYFGDLLRKKLLTSTIYKYVAQGLKEEATGDFLLHNFTLQRKPDILHLAARHGHVELVDILLGLNPEPYDIDQVNSVGVTALLCSVGRGNRETVKFLLEKGADPKRERRDGLNALQIAKYAAHYDPREVELIQRYVGKDTKEEVKEESENTKKVSRRNLLKEESEDQLDEFEKERVKVERKEESARKRAAEEEERERKRIKKLQPSAVFSKEKTPDRPRPKTPDQLRAKTPEPPKEKQSSPSPGPLTKAQEEQKAKAAEEARVWQEKTEAKKRARKEYFLKAKKEEERRRQEEEKRKLEEQEQLQKQKEHEHVQQAQRQAEESRQEEARREQVLRDKIVERYPVGLRYIELNSAPTETTVRRYAPLYVFEYQGDEWVVDLQVALLTLVSYDEFSQRAQFSEKSLLDNDTKSRIYLLFYGMVGRDPAQPTKDLRGEQFSKFQDLSLHFVKLSEVKAVIEKEYTQVFEWVWSHENVCRVSLDSLVPFDEKRELNGKPPLREVPKYWVPPALRRNKRFLQYLHKRRTPMW